MNTARNALMRQMYLEGMLLNEIAAHFKCTRQNVQTILRRRFGITRKDGGASRRIKAETVRLAHIDNRCRDIYGISKDERRRLGPHPFSAFSYQKRNAHRRGIPFRMKFSEWWRIWDESGKWPLRGTRLGCYVMARYGDVGAYEPGNVKIITASENHSECRRSTKSDKSTEFVSTRSMA